MYINCIYLFSHLADAFIQSDLQMSTLYIYLYVNTYKPVLCILRIV